MHIYVNLIILGTAGIALLIFSSIQAFNPLISLPLAVFSYGVFLTIAFFNTRTWLDKEHNRKIRFLKEKYEKKIRRIKNEYDTAMLEKTIREGTKTLIKNAVDYFKIENIKQEMPPSAAIQNLQLDKYGQIIELLADFSLILPDYEENKQIVLQEINHQIDIYQIDEKPFADFLRTILGKYQMTVKKKLREKIQQDEAGYIKSCPSCARKIPAEARMCRHCGHNFIARPQIHKMPVQRKKEPSPPPVTKKPKSPQEPEEEIRKGFETFRAGKVQEAINHLTKVIELHPGAAGGYFSRGMIYRKINNNERAVADFETASRLGHERARQMLDILKMSQTCQTTTTS